MASRRSAFGLLALLPVLGGILSSRAATAATAPVHGVPPFSPEDWERKVLSTAESLGEWDGHMHMMRVVPFLSMAGLLAFRIAQEKGEPLSRTGIRDALSIPTREWALGWMEPGSLRSGVQASLECLPGWQQSTPGSLSQVTLDCDGYLGLNAVRILDAMSLGDLGVQET